MALKTLLWTSGYGKATFSPSFYAPTQMKDLLEPLSFRDFYGVAASHPGFTVDQVCLKLVQLGDILIEGERIEVDIDGACDPFFEKLFKGSYVQNNKIRVTLVFLN